jgi:tetratricopeptide (TPR) repeat protein
MEGRTPVSPLCCALIDKEMQSVRHIFLLKKTAFGRIAERIGTDKQIDGWHAMDGRVKELRMMMRWTCILVLWLLVTGAVAVAESNIVATAREMRRDGDIAALIRSLGAETFAEREEASRALREVGAEALEALEVASKSADPEVRLRAAKILAEVRLGITPAWNQELADLARSFDSLSASDKASAMVRINREAKADAVPFLVLQLRNVDDSLASNALRLLREQDSEEAAKRVLRWLQHPQSPLEHMAVAWAQQRLGHPVEALEILVRQNLTDPMRSQITSQAIGALQTLWKARQFDALLNQVIPWTKAAPDEARFLYYQAEALDGLRKADEAAAIRAQALALHPEDEAAHYTVGDMLFEMGLWEASEREWKKILEIPPAGDVYDMNALLRLGDICIRNNQFNEAAGHYQKVLDQYRQARARGGSGLGIVGITEKDLELRITQLRDQGVRAEPRRDNDFFVDVEETVKDDKLKELREALASAEATMTLRVQPYGFRLFDLDAAGLWWDSEKKHLVPLLNGSPCSDAVPFRPRAKSSRVAMRTLDCVYIFEIDPETGEAKKLARYEKDYTITLKPGRTVRELRDIRLTLNGEPADWQEFLKGRQFDFLPATFKLHLNGENEKGDPVELDVDLTDPMHRKASEF